MKNRYYVSIVGKSNVGKSTLLNLLCDKYISTESKKPQTTRINIYSETTISELNIKFIDTPGITLDDNSLLSSTMKNSYIKSLDLVDLVVLVLDIENMNNRYDDSIINLMSSNRTRFLVLVNKIDLVDSLSEEKISMIKEELSHISKDNISMISLKDNLGIEHFINRGLVDNLKNLKLKKKDIVDSSTHKLLTIQEIIRGVIVDTTFNELPYDTAVHASNLIIDKKLIKIKADIIVQKTNQKKIIIGKNGEMIKLIGTKSRKILEELYKTKFYLSLNVVVKENWKNNYNTLKDLKYIE